MHRALDTTLAQDSRLFPLAAISQLCALLEAYAGERLARPVKREVGPLLAVIGTSSHLPQIAVAMQRRAFLRSNRDELRTPQLSVSSHKRHSMYDAGGSDDLIGGIAVKVQ